MSEKPISFITEMVQAILRGDKTQTRRVIKIQPEWVEQDKKYRSMPSGWRWKGHCFETDKDLVGALLRSARYKPGDVLWVRETSARVVVLDNTREERYLYKADKIDLSKMLGGICWRSPRFMRREAARIFLRVTEVRVEWLHDISADDCLAEGITGAGIEENALNMFAELWHKLNAKRGYGWDTNPWVYVYTFERIAEV